MRLLGGAAAHLVIALSVLATAVASVTTYYNPGQRWTQLQGAALAMESEWYARFPSTLKACRAESTVETR